MESKAQGGSKMRKNKRAEAFLAMQSTETLQRWVTALSQYEQDANKVARIQAELQRRGS